MGRLIFFITLILSLGACGKQVAQDDPGSVKKNFGVSVMDGKVNILDSYQPLKSGIVFQANGAVVDIPSSRWLGLANQLMETGAILDGPYRDRLLQAGHNLSQAFYNFPESHTLMTGTSNPVGNPWVEAAYYYGKPMMIKEMNDGLDSVEGKVKIASGHVQISVGDLGADPLPEDVIQRIIDGLKGFEQELISMRDGTGDSIIDQVTSTVDAKYIKDLTTLRDSARMDRSRPLVNSLKSLSTSLSQMTEVTDLERQRLLMRVSEGITLATRGDAIKNSTDALNLLLDFWLSTDARSVVPSSVKKIFSGLSDSQILALATMNQPKIFSDDQWNSFKNRTDYSLVPDRQMVALFLGNNGALLNSSDWGKLSATVLPQLQAVLNSPEVQGFVNLYAEEYPFSQDDRIFVLVSNWLNLSGRISFPSDLKKGLQSYGDDDLEQLRSKGTLGLAATLHGDLTLAHYQMLAGIESYGSSTGQSISSKQGIQNFKDYFASQIVSATRSRLDNALTPIAANLAQQLQDNIVPNLEDQKKNVDQTSNSTYRIYSRYYLGKLVFGADLKKGSLDNDPEAADNALLANYALPLLEKNFVRLVNKAGRMQDEPSNDVTSAELLGTSIINNLDRLGTLQTYENAPINGRGAVALDFQIVSKLLVLAGYRGYDSSLAASLSVAMTPGHHGERLDIRNYNPDVSVFATPDVIRIQDQFRLDPLSEQSPRVSVLGQMSLLHAYSQLLGYYKPWMPSQFDVGLGALRIEEEPNLIAFDRGDYFLLSLGLSSIILKNISPKMLGLITAKNDFVESAQVSDPDSVQAIGAVLGDFDQSKMSHKISAAGMAQAIRALSEFYDQTKDLGLTTNPTIIDTFKQQPLDQVRASVQKLVSGLIVFVTGHLMNSDGGVAPSYDGDAKKVSDKPRSLSDQLMMEQALLEAGEVFDSDFMRSKAIDNLFFLNTHFWNAKLGFYSQQENSSGGQVRLCDVALALKNVHAMEKIYPHLVTQSAIFDSLAQFNRLENLWEKRFFASPLDQLPVAQVFEFSP